jgi:hypothetical protein
MTSREHARRLMLILLSSPGRPGAGDAPADGHDERRDGAAGERDEDPADPDEQARRGLVEAYTWA